MVGGWEKDLKESLAKKGTKMPLSHLSKLVHTESNKTLLLKPVLSLFPCLATWSEEAHQPFIPIFGHFDVALCEAHRIAKLYSESDGLPSLFIALA
jgi:hypothetical protein